MNYRFEEEPHVNSEYFKRILGNRVNEIECVIDNHLIAANSEIEFELKLRELE